MKPEGAETVSGVMSAAITHIAEPLTKEWGPSVLTDVVREVAKNAAMRIPAVRAARQRRPRADVLFTADPEEFERYAIQSVRSLLGIVGSVRGLDIVEFGPGDSLTVNCRCCRAKTDSARATPELPLLQLNLRPGQPPDSTQ